MVRYKYNLLTFIEITYFIMIFINKKKNIYFSFSTKSPEVKQTYNISKHLKSRQRKNRRFHQSFSNEYYIHPIYKAEFRAEFHLYLAKYFTIHRKPSFTLNFIFSSCETRILLLIQGFVFRYLNCTLIAQIHCSSSYRTISLAVRNCKRLIDIHICARCDAFPRYALPEIIEIFDFQPCKFIT